MFRHVSVVPCQGCGNMIIYDPRSIDNLSVCVACDEGILKIVQLGPKSSKDKDGNMLFYDFYNHNTICRRLPPKPYQSSRDYSGINKTFIEDLTFFKCFEAKSLSAAWRLFDRAFTGPNGTFKYSVLSKICSIRAKGVLTMCAYNYIMGFSNQNVYHIGIQEDAERIKYYPELMALPRKVTIFGEDVVNHVDVFRYVPCAILCKSRESAIKLHDMLFSQFFTNTGNIHLHYSMCVDENKCMIRIGDTKSLTTTLLLSLKKHSIDIPNDITEKIVNLFKCVTPFQHNPSFIGQR